MPTKWHARYWPRGAPESERCWTISGPGHHPLRPAPRAQTGQLDRKALADIVFSDATERLALEAITHPLIRGEVLRRVALADNEVVVIEIPLLDKSRKVDYGLDVVVLVDAPENVAVQRAVGTRDHRSGSPRPYCHPTIGRGTAAVSRSGAR